MFEIIAVLAGSCIAGRILFFGQSKAGIIFSAGRWMLLSWIILGLFTITSPVTFEKLSISSEAILFSALWVAFFLFGELLGQNLGHSASPNCPEIATTAQFTRLCQLLLILSCVGSIGFINYILSSLGSLSGSEALGDLRELQLNSEQSTLKTVFQVLAFAGLPASLILISQFIMSNRRITIYAWSGILSFISIYFALAGRQGIAICSVALIVTIIGSLRFGAANYAHWRSISTPVVALLILFASYFAFNVATRSTSGGSMDTKLEMIEKVYGVYVDPEFRRSMRSIGPAGDSITELYAYFSTQMPGISTSLKSYQSDHDFGLNLIPHITRRIEGIFDINILRRMADSEKNVFLAVGMPANFFQTGAFSTFQSFGSFGSLIFMCFCGLLSGRSRYSLELGFSPNRVALQAILL